MKYFKKITSLICGILLLASGASYTYASHQYASSDTSSNTQYQYTSTNSPYRYTRSDTQYKYTYPDAPYKYTTPESPYKYTYPDAPYRYTRPDTQYKYTYPDAPYKYTYPEAPYRYTFPDAPYKYTYPDAPYRYTHPEAPYKYTFPETPYKYTDLKNEPLYPDKSTKTEDLKNDYANYHVQTEDSDLNPYWDIEGHYAENHIIKLHELGIIDGYPDGSFKPDFPVTRAEMAKLVVKSTRIKILSEEYDRNLYFADLDEWQAPYVNAAYSLTIVEGYYDPVTETRFFLPNVKVNRAEGVKMVIASAGIQPGEMTESLFVDVEGWMIPWVEVSRSIGVTPISEDMHFYPTHNLTRGAAAMMIGRMIDFQSE